MLRKKSGNHYDVLGPLLDPIVAATGRIVDNASLTKAPYPASDVISDIQWSPVDSIVRRAEGSDNWPVTWGDDDRLYTAYGDGWGFQPKTKRKLSLGIASVGGGTNDFVGVNVRSKDAEQDGQGAEGMKASGMLMIDGVLYMLIRNAGNSLLGWSNDHGVTWEWADWKFTKGFGCPTFLNFGKNYTDRPHHTGDYVYIYSHDGNSAYKPADRMVMARVPKDKIRLRGAYEFFAGVHPQLDTIEWTNDVDLRGAVFEHEGSCYRSGITYNAGLKRYFWCQTLLESKDERGPRFQGGFGIYEAPRPWGPWKTVFFTREWDVGPGESSRFPTKWISEDGRVMHLVFSGDDHFSVRKAVLVTR